MKVVIIIPTYNEAKNIEPFVSELQEACKESPQHEMLLLVVDDNSPDGTGKLVRKLMKIYPRATTIISSSINSLPVKNDAMYLLIKSSFK